MKSKGSSFVTIAEAHSEVESIKLKMLLDRTGIPYFVRGDQLHSVMGDIYGATAFGPRQFVVPERYQQQVEEMLQELFEVTVELPSHCPACGTRTQPDRLECPECGLYLG